MFLNARVLNTITAITAGVLNSEEASTSTLKRTGTASKPLRNAPKKTSTNAPRKAPISTASRKLIGQDQQKSFVYENMAVEVSSKWFSLKIGH